MQVGPSPTSGNLFYDCDLKTSKGVNQNMQSDAPLSIPSIFSTPPKNKSHKRTRGEAQTHFFPTIPSFPAPFPPFPPNFDVCDPSRFKKQKQDDISQIESSFRMLERNCEEQNQKKAVELVASIKLRAASLPLDKIDFTSIFNEEALKSKISNNDSYTSLATQLIDDLNNFQKKISFKNLYPLLHKALRYQQLELFEVLLNKNISLLESRKTAIRKLNKELWKEISKNAISFTQIMLKYVSDLSYLEESTQAALYFQAEELSFQSEKESLDVLSNLLNKQVRILSQYPIDASSTYSGMTPFLYAVKIGNLKLVEKIWEFNPPLESCDHWRNNALHLACQYGHLEIAHFLSQRGFKFTGNQILHTLKFNEIVKLGQIEILDFLLQLNVKPDFTPSFIDSLLLNDEITKYLLEKSTPSQRIELLHHLAEQKSIDYMNNHIFESVISRLLTFGHELSPFNSPNEHGISFFFKLALTWDLHLKIENSELSTKKSMFEVLSWLFRNGIHPLKTDVNNSGTILHLLIHWKHFELLKQILEYPEFIDVSIRDINNKTALELAEEALADGSITAKLRSLHTCYQQQSQG